MNLESDLEVERKKNERLEALNRKLVEQRNADLPRAELQEAHTTNGRLAASLELIEKQKVAAEKALEKEREEKASAQRAAEELRKDRDEKKTELATAKTDKRVNYWAPSIAIAACAVIMLYVFLFAGRVVPNQNGSSTIESVQQKLNDVSNQLQLERVRQNDIQKPDEIWNIGKMKTQDGKVVIHVAVYFGEKGAELKPGAKEFVSSLLCAAIRRNTRVVQQGGDSGTFYLSPMKAENLAMVHWPTYLNEELAKHLGGISEIMPSFNWTFTMEFLEQKNAQQSGSGGMFRDGKFTDQGLNEKGGPIGG